MNLRALAETAAREAGALLRERPMGVTHKGVVDLVTEVDLASERLIRARLEPSGIPVQGEEGGGATTGTRWAVDPLDGTTNFVHGFPFYCVSIALVEGDTPTIGVIYDPIRDRLFSARAGAGAQVNGAPLHVSAVDHLDDALSVTGFPYDRRTRAAAYLPRVEAALTHTQGLRRTGSAAMDLATLASGASDLYWEENLKPWDTSAGVVLVREAGGVVTRIDGSPWNPGAPDILATNPGLHAAVVEMLGEA